MIRFRLRTAFLAMAVIALALAVASIPTWRAHALARYILLGKAPQALAMLDEDIADYDYHRRMLLKVCEMPSLDLPEWRVPRVYTTDLTLRQLIAGRRGLIVGTGTANVEFIVTWTAVVKGRKQLRQ